jgi:hypothetical protein
MPSSDEVFCAFVGIELGLPLRYTGKRSSAGEWVG